MCNRVQCECDGIHNDPNISLCVARAHRMGFEGSTRKYTHQTTAQVSSFCFYFAVSPQYKPKRNVRCRML